MVSDIIYSVTAVTAPPRRSKRILNKPRVHYSTSNSAASYSNKYNSMYAIRSNLLHSIFAKNNLVFTDEAMTFYDIWSDAYQLECFIKVNRYQKMVMFVANHGELFTL